MTGGTLPAMTWHNIMAYAHQGVELRPLPGLPPPEHAPTMTDTSFQGSEEPHAVLLTRKGTDTLVQLEQMLDDADHATDNKGADNRTGAFATAADHGPTAASRGD
jgi:penicillin-binding protein 1A